MNWVKTYEAFIYEGSSPNPDVNKFESIIGIPKGTGVITSVIFDKAKHTLEITLMKYINVFDHENVMNSVKKNLKTIKTEYSGATKIHLGSAVIEL